jgi:hypothetical protein
VGLLDTFTNRGEMTPEKATKALWKLCDKKHETPETLQRARDLIEKHGAVPDALIPWPYDQGFYDGTYGVSEDVTTLHIAASHGHIGMCRLLLEKGVDVNAATSSRHSPDGFWLDAAARCR